MKTDRAETIVNFLYKRDLFTRWLGIKKVEIKPGFCKLRMKVRKEMVNGFSIAHGGIAFSLADTALAFASNSRGKHSVSIETSISLLEPVRKGDVLTAVAKELGLSEKTGVYLVSITNRENKKVAVFRGTVYRKSREWFK